uniref:Uncharacterized protein n=1 Tax=Rhizophagus irregularis (strain DAOM 181602 / DAOM 197198 / MUCL 43194) TaxID=747089 RepID=U9TWJ6_RHIID
MRSNDLSCLSYRGFLESNRDTIITSITSTNTCNGLDNIWIHHFLKEAELLLDQKLFIALKNKGNSYVKCVWARRITGFVRFQAFNSGKRGTLAAQETFTKVLAGSNQEGE